MPNFSQLICEFFNQYNNGNANANENDWLKYCFNEKSLQHELGQYLRNQLGDDYIVQYERNVDYFAAISDNNYVTNESPKKEMDIVILKNSDFDLSNIVNDIQNRKLYKPVCTIELKYPRQYKEGFGTNSSSIHKEEELVVSPNVLKNYLTDISFGEFLKDTFDCESYSIFVTDHKSYYPSGVRRNTCKNSALYDLFTKGNMTFDANYAKSNQLPDFYKLNGSYTFKWTMFLQYADEMNNSLQLYYMINKAQ